MSRIGRGMGFGMGGFGGRGMGFAFTHNMLIPNQVLSRRTQDTRVIIF